MTPGPRSTRTPNVLVPLADGFEEIEAVTVIDVLRRAEIGVTTATLDDSGDLGVTGSHAIRVLADARLADIDLDEVDALVLPGGMPGTRHLTEDERVVNIVQALVERGQPVAAICAAPSVLAVAGVLEGRQATSHPAWRDRLAGAAVLGEPAVVTSDGIVTSQGVGTALAFALELVRQWKGRATAEALAEAMVV